MKYSKIIGKNVENKITYLVVVIFSVLLFSILCFGGINFHLMATWFTGNTVVIDSPYNVIYYSNFPNDITNSDSFHIDDAGNSYTIIDNQFDIPNGYEFIGWNTEKDGSGVFYQKGDNIEMSKTFVLYAQWNFVSGDDSDGSGEETDDSLDDNTDSSSEDMEDSENSETGDNDDSSLEEDNIEEENNGEGNLDGEVTVGGSTGSGGNGSGSTSGNGSGSLSGNGSSSENSSSTTVGGNGKPSGNTSGPSNNANNNGTSVLPKQYQFKYVDNDKEFAITSCEVSSDGTCELVFPNDKPNMDGHIFIGWGVTAICDSEIITGPIKVDSDKIYYACYKIDEVDTMEETDGNKFNIFYIIVSIWIIASISIYFVIRNFKRNNKNIDND